MSKRKQNRVPTRPRNQTPPQNGAHQFPPETPTYPEAQPVSVQDSSTASWIGFVVVGGFGLLFLVFVGALIANLTGAVLFPLLGIGAAAARLG